MADPGMSPDYSDPISAEMDRTSGNYGTSQIDPMSFNDGLYEMFSNFVNNDDYSFGYTPEIGSSWNMGSSGGFLNSSITPDASAFGSFFDDNPFGKALKALGRGLMNAHPVGRGINLALSAMDFAKNPTVAGAVGVGSRAIGGLPGAIANAGYQGIAQGNWGPAAGTLAANIAGRATGSGEIASLAGQFASDATRAGLGDRQGASPNTETQGGGMQGEGFDIAPLAQGLLSLYGMSQANRGIQDAGKMNSAVQQQINQLSDMFSPTGVYANHMREVLARKDAAAGRNSQYGPREAQLMALLAEKQAQAANTIGNLAQTGQQNRFAAADRRNQLLGQGGALLMNLGKQTGLFDIFKNARTAPINPGYSNNRESFDLSSMGGYSPRYEEMAPLYEEY